MIEGKTVLAVIPARGGSKRLPRKNLAMLCGKPLIAWSIESAKRSKYIDCLVLSSEDDEILEVAKEHGCDTVRRPEHLATDDAKTEDVMLHALDGLGGYDYVACLQPTSPQRRAEDIDEAIEAADRNSACSLYSVDVSERPDGVVYVARSRDLWREKTFFMRGAWKLVRSSLWHVDIDTAEDLERAEQAMSAR